MSLYFFTLDSLRVFSVGDEGDILNDSWPSPTISELWNALSGLCGREWEDVYQDGITDKIHAYTRTDVLPHRCVESVYMVTLLKDGFGFHPNSRDITFLYELDGSEVEWTLGMALTMG
eukprot:CAMPEP_0195528320 /NCGR_PEP_ID=MMETSP0794_2-20130614/30409_1 /TAXON_ID=515487 /ORGANISM="Stephanopyxis turris, Strain CCMP 815" /LENGTH=117 /DNA_ID=CAMNT_0040659441 /DNA_START=129 /DNA_END=482 /DNA_ORIENTATION=+